MDLYVADDDFIEHLHEHGFETIEFDELFIEWDDWAKENVIATGHPSFQSIIWPD
jgi:hypothetical protein